jgi:hypothetical protein
MKIPSNYKNLQGFYTYIHYRLSDNLPFYVGKGSTDRAWLNHHRNSHWHSTVKKHGIKVQIATIFDNENEAFEHEKLLISCFKDLGIKLTNKTNGGEGSGSYIRTAETRAKFSAIHKGKIVSEETRLKISKSKTGAKIKPCSEETKAKISAAQKGKPRPYANKENRTEAIKIAQEQNLLKRLLRIRAQKQSLEMANNGN